MSGNSDEVHLCFCRAMLEAEEQSIKKKAGRNRRKIVPWWTNECNIAAKSRNKVKPNRI